VPHVSAYRRQRHPIVVRRCCGSPARGFHDRACRLKALIRITCACSNGILSVRERGHHHPPPESTSRVSPSYGRRLCRGMDRRSSSTSSSTPGRAGYSARDGRGWIAQLTMGRRCAPAVCYASQWLRCRQTLVSCAASSPGAASADASWSSIKSRSPTALRSRGRLRDYELFLDGHRLRRGGQKSDFPIFLTVGTSDGVAHGLAPAVLRSPCPTRPGCHQRSQGPLFQTC